MKKRILSIIMILVTAALPFELIAQKQPNTKIDSLLKVLEKHESDDTIKVKILNDITFNYYGIDPRIGIGYGEKGIKLSEDLNDQNGLMWCLISTGACYWAASDYPKALELLFRALNISEKTNNKPGIAKASGNIGNVYAELAKYNDKTKKENYDKALEYYTKALKISQELKDTKGIARKLGNIGTIYKELENYSVALDYYFKALKYYQEAGEKRGIAVTLQNIGWAYSDLADYKKALEFFQKAIEIARQNGEPRWIMYDYGTIGELYYNLATDTTEKNPNFLLNTKSQKENYLKQAIDYAEKAVEIGEKIGATKQLIDWYHDQSDAYRQLGDWKNAFNFLKQSHIMKDSVYTQENNIKLANLDARRETEVKEKEIQLQKTRLEKANIQRLAEAGGLLGLIIIILLIYLSRRKSEKLLLNMLPATIARRLKKKEKPIADLFEEAAVVFIDIVEFTKFSKDKDPRYVVEVLTEFFTCLDKMAGKYGMEKIKTIGDCYMAVSGLPEPIPDSIPCAARFALESRDLMRSYTTKDGQHIHVRIGMDAGKVVAGVIGERKFSYDLWGDVVNTAAKMENQGIEGEIQVTENVMKKLDSSFILTERGEIEIKGKGKMKTWLLIGTNGNKN
ncbi:MAG: tetratricopeptide repeat protein [Bacteroidetes bacterium]|nr:tetratricopeptide repeat protein [Bacteroidota bacterium]